MSIYTDIHIFAIIPRYADTLLANPREDSMNPLPFYKALADETRLRCLLLIQREGELCVCELVAALDEIQPKMD